MDQVCLTVLMPCLNEASTLPNCIRKAQAYLSRAGLRGEILVADNGSGDGSRDVAHSLGARVVTVAARGYGNALRAGIEAARGKYVVMGDADDSYDFSELDGFVRKLQEGFDLVIGNRFAGGIRPGAMPVLHRYVGNPLLSFLGRVFFGSPVRDLYCGLRGFRREAILSLGLQTPGMEFALEMIVKASIDGFSIAEVPTTLSPDGRGRSSHLRTLRDGWRSLRFYLLMCPRWLFLYPGACLALFGGTASALLLFSDIGIGGVVFSYHSLILTAAMTNIGVQSVFFWAFASIVGVHTGLLPSDSSSLRFQRTFPLERCLGLGSALIIFGFGAAAFALLYWSRLNFGAIGGDMLIKTVSAASFLAVLGFQLIFSSFFICLLDRVPDQLAAKSKRSRQLTAAARET
jgi:glycosyltransferase involved in cell wall biosynthesis